MAGRGLQRLTAVMLAGAVLLLTPGAASAQPSTQLPDADLWCGTAYGDKVDAFIGLPTGASQWVVDPVYGGHYVVRSVAHYLADGLLTGPVQDVSGLELLYAKSYGAGTGLPEPIDCQVVSRFADQNITVIAPVTMSRIP